MTTHSTDGRLWAKLSTTKPGDFLIADGGFDCIKEGAKLLVHERDGMLYVECTHGRHYLDGQLDYDMDSLVGLRRTK